MKVIIQVNIAADEVPSNVARHSGAAAVQADRKMMDERVVIRFKDDGKPCGSAVQPKPDPTLPEEQELAGPEVFTAKKSVDLGSYAYVDGRNSLAVQKTGNTRLMKRRRSSRALCCSCVLLRRLWADRPWH